VKCKERYEAEDTWYSGTELHKIWNAAKKADPTLAWWVENSKCAYQEAFRDLDLALRDFIKSRKGQRKGRRLGFPRFKRRGRCRDSFRFSTGVIRCDRSSVTLPRLGSIATHESTRKLARRLENGTARIMSATVSVRRSGGSCRSPAKLSASSLSITPDPARPPALIWASKLC
jgi:putative transposase